MGKYDKEVNSIMFLAFGIALWFFIQTYDPLWFIAMFIVDIALGIYMIWSNLQDIAFLIENRDQE